MKQWKAKINLWDIHASYRSGEITIDECAVKLAERLDGYCDRTFAKDSEEFEQLRVFSDSLRSDVEGDAENYDCILCDIYDWADEEKRLWLCKFEPSGGSVIDLLENLGGPIDV